jgi:hypothetical protein
MRGLGQFALGRDAQAFLFYAAADGPEHGLGVCVCQFLQLMV